MIVHGAGGNALAWEDVIARLSDACAVDLPGHGASPPRPPHTIAGYAAAVRETLEALAGRAGAPGALLAGHSMGGAIALEVALDPPPCLRGLALLGTGGRLRVTQSILGFMKGLRPGADLVPFVRAGFAAGAAEDRVRALAERVAGSMVAMGHADFVACDAFDRLSDLERVGVPTLVLCGGEDPLTPVKYSKHLASAIPGATLALIDGVGHMLEVEAPDEVADALDAFRRRLGEPDQILKKTPVVH